MATSCSQRARVQATLFVAVSMAIAGCASTAPMRQAVIERGYPTKEQLDGVSKAPLPPREESLKKGRTVEEWELAGPFPDRAGSIPFAGEDPLAQVLAQRLAGQRSDVVLTESMQCYAREIGLFVARYGELPEDDLQAFAAGRCGVLPITPSILYALPPEGLPDEATLKFVDDVLFQVQASSEIGIWQGGDATRRVVLATFGSAKATLASVDATHEGGGGVRIRGTLLDRTAWLRAYTGDGAFGFSACKPTRDAMALLPDFDMTCKIASDDPYAVFDMLAAAPQALLGRQALMLVLSTGRPLPSTFRRLAVYGVSSRGSLLEQFNAVRAKLGRGALRDVPMQSRTAYALIPHYFAAAASKDFTNLDFITLGMMAGWDVPGPLRDSQFLSFRGALTRGGPSFLSQLLFFPSNRAVLLDANAHRAALAAWQDEKSKSVWGMLATYTVFEPRSYPEVEAALLDELDRQRQARGKPPAVRADTRETQGILGHVMDKVEQGDISPLEGMQQALRTLSRRKQRPFLGRTSYALAVDGWRPTFEGGLVDDENVSVISKVGFFAAPGDHWGQYVCYLIYGQAFDVNRGSNIPKRERP